MAAGTCGDIDPQDRNDALSGLSPALACVAVVSVVVSLVIIVLSLTWIVALLGMFRGMEGENRYGPRPEM